MRFGMGRTLRLNVRQRWARWAVAKCGCLGFVWCWGEPLRLCRLGQSHVYRWDLCCLLWVWKGNKCLRTHSLWFGCLVDQWVGVYTLHRAMGVPDVLRCTTVRFLTLKKEMKLLASCDIRWNSQFVSRKDTSFRWWFISEALYWRVQRFAQLWRTMVLLKNIWV